MSKVKGVDLEALRVHIPGKVFNQGDSVDDFAISLPLKRGYLKWLKETINQNGCLYMYGSTGTDDPQTVVVAFGWGNNCFNGDLWEALQQDKVFGFVVERDTLKGMHNLLGMLMEHLGDDD